MADFTRKYPLLAALLVAFLVSVSTTLIGSTYQGSYALSSLGTSGRVGYVFPMFAGNGSDGAYAPAGNDTLTFTSAGKQHTSVTIADGAVITIADDGTCYGSFRWGCQGNFSLGAGASIVFTGLGSAARTAAVSTASDANGAACGSSIPGLPYTDIAPRSGFAIIQPSGVGGGGGGASATRTGGAGGGTFASPSITISGPSGGGVGATGSSGTDISASTCLFGGPWWLDTAALVPALSGSGGGAGGGNGGGRGGKGGNGGPGVVIEVGGTCTGSGTILASGASAPAENAASNTGPGKGATDMGSGGGGGGGAGGQLAVLCRGTASNPWTLTAAGGTGAAGALANGGGGAGGTGRNGAAGRTAYQQVP